MELVTHTVCGTPVTWKLGRTDRAGGPWCEHCYRKVDQTELSEGGPICTMEATDVREIPDTKRPDRRW